MSTLMNRLLALRSFRKNPQRFEEICTKIYYFHLNCDDDELLNQSLENNINSRHLNQSKFTYYNCCNNYCNNCCTNNLNNNNNM